MVRISTPVARLDDLAPLLEARPDAVYAGLEGWSRGRPASELPSKDMAELVRRCHDAGVEAHVCLNTVPGDAEVALLRETLASVAGADAVVLSDRGAIGLAREVVPDVPVFASVGLAARNAADLDVLAGAGCRVACMTPKALLEMPKSGRTPPLEVEVLADSACRVFVPGTCMLSGYLVDKPDAQSGGRTRNRRSAKRGGTCYRLCRSLFPDAPGSAVDEALARRLADAGADWIKLGGRGQSGAEIAARVRTLRGAL